MKTIQIVVEEDLLEVVDREARRARQNRSQFFREAAREHLKRRRLRELEKRDRAGYERHPPVEFDVWDKVLSWPDE
jgi:metal-responsive CopG/Arc/MetJ family transcriptional regulator